MDHLWTMLEPPLDHFEIIVEIMLGIFVGQCLHNVWISVRPVLGNLWSSFCRADGVSAGLVVMLDVVSCLMPFGGGLIRVSYTSLSKGQVTETITQHIGKQLSECLVAFGFPPWPPILILTGRAAETGRV